MNNPNFRDDVVVKLVNGMVGDYTIVNAAKASVDEFDNDQYISDMLRHGQFLNADSDMLPKHKGLIGYLMREKHGSPFEHNAMTFYVNAPIMVFREFMRHRIASYNEMSGRYTELPGDFYIPNKARPLVNVGSSARPVMDVGTPEQYDVMYDAHQRVYQVAWEEYNRMLDAGIANEIARDVLPVGLYSKMYVTMNLRSIFNFLSLRVEDPTAKHHSRPQLEIEMVAKKMEAFVEASFPVAHGHFTLNGRVAP